MARDMFKTAVAQMASKAGDVRANLDTIESLVNEASGRGAAFVVLPELAPTGSVGDDRISVLAEPIPGDTSSALCEIAKTNSLYLACGIIERAGSAYHNTAVLCGPGGSLVATDPAPNLPSLISRIFSGYGPNWGGLQTRWV